MVEVIDSNNTFIVFGHYQIGSIAVRVLTFENEPIDFDFWKKRLEVAFGMRESLGLITENNNTYRLVHGEGDYLPGLIVDVYHDTAVMQAHTPGMHYVRDILAKALVEVSGAKIKNVYYKSETTLPYKADLGAENGYLIGEYNNSDIALENGLKFHVDWLRGQKTGFFVDQRETGSIVEKFSI